MNGRFVLAALVALLAAAGGWWAGRQSAPPAAATQTSAPAERTILYYRNPMGLPDTSPVPKKDSMGMDYVPVYAGEAPATPGTVVVSPERVQTTGVRVDTVRSAPWAAALRFPAVLALDESRQRIIAPRFEGWVQRLAADQTGKAFRRGELLLTAYSPEYLAAQQEYLVAHRAQQALGPAESAARMGELAQAALQRLRNFGVGESGIERLRRGEVQRELAIVAPIDGVITARPVLAGARFMAGETVLEMADYSQLWAVAQVPAGASAQVAVGQRARFRSEALPGRSFTGEVTLLAPTLDPATRTLAVRVALANPEGLLRPELYGALVFDAAPGRPVLQIPRSALLDSGLRQRVFVELSAGRYEPREVRVGRREGDWIEIQDGLAEGERIVVAGNFLIDAESRLGEVLEEPGHAARGTGHGEDQEHRVPEAQGVDAGAETAAPSPDPAAHDHRGG
ncbi:MAG: efflux RND transporter periplasmic adaptor subunit [Rhodanobacteraceae bacterium]|nr:efflux RND transporter periplasmic adaptor subunit [Rhodanobacteraceae bacterium]